MSKAYTKEELKEIRTNIDTHELVKYFMERDEKFGNQFRYDADGRIYWRKHKSLKITKGYGWIWNTQHTTGNVIDFLLIILKYSFPEAMSIISSYTEEREKYYLRDLQCEDIEDIETPSKLQKYNDGSNIIFPIKDIDNVRIIRYLKNERHLPQIMLDWLIDKKLIYQGMKYQNVVFSNGSDFVEVHGIVQQKKNQKYYKGCAKSSKSDGYWSFTIGDEKPRQVYVCEGAIDAISLFLINKICRFDKSYGCYISLLGVKPNTLKRILKEYTDSIIYLCVDSDGAGNDFAKTFSNIPRLIPAITGENGITYKDWNELYVKEELYKYY